MPDALPPVPLLLGLLLGGALLAALLLRGGPARRTARLRARYLQALHQPPAQGAATLARALERVRQRFPGRDEAWYLRWLLEELRRDRR
jgi:hypothetical protein